MLQMDLQSIARILNGKLYGHNAIVCGVSIDSRKTEAGQLFFAIRGERVDPHDLLPEVAAKGASAAIVETKQAIDLPQLVVENAYLALGKLAQFWREQFSLPLIGVTGSNGKTTLKNMITSILIEACHGDESRVLYNFGNLNSGFGLPLTLLRLSDQHRVGVLEMGMSTPGEIAYISKIARPQVVAINNVFPCHVEGVGSLCAIAEEKSEIIRGLKGKGVVVLNKDDEYFDFWREKARAHAVISFGLDSKSHFTAKHISSDVASKFELHTPQGSAVVQLQLLGQHNVTNALAAAACATALAIPLENIVAGLENTTAYHGRLQEQHLSSGATLINDAYNANPGSVCAAIDVLKQYHGTRILVLGDMKELGVDEIALHEEVGHYAKLAGIDTVFAVGPLMQHAVDAFGENGRWFENHEALVEALRPRLVENVIVLVKGSLSMNMLSIVVALSDSVFVA